MSAGNQELIPALVRAGPETPAKGEGGRQDLSQGLAKLVLTLLETLKQLMEKQAGRRVREGSLDENQIERLGLAFANLDSKISEIAALFDFSKKDLDLNLSPIQRAYAQHDGNQADDGEFLSLVDLLDRVIEKGVVVFGDVGISVAEVELINVQLRLIVSAVKKDKGRISRAVRVKNDKTRRKNAQVNRQKIRVRNTLSRKARPNLTKTMNGHA